MADDVEVQERDCGHRTCPQYSRNIKLAIMTLRWVYSTGNVEQQRVIIEKRPYVWVFASGKFLGSSSISYRGGREDTYVGLQPPWMVVGIGHF